MTNHQLHGFSSDNRQQLIRLEKMYKNDPETFKDILDFIPMLVVINEVDTWDYRFSNNHIKNLLNIDSVELVENGMERVGKYVHPENLAYQRKMMGRFIKYDPHNTLSYFQFIRKEGSNEHFWVHTHKKFLTESTYLSTYYDLSQIEKVYSIMSRHLGELYLSTETFMMFESLTQREREVLRLIVKGYSNNDIGSHLFLSTNTVRTHRNRIWKKLEIKQFNDCLKYELMF
ncbi:MAG: helix-turn-helix transcriptional regulator [Reichenbachiella sp.]